MVKDKTDLANENKFKDAMLAIRLPQEELDEIEVKADEAGLKRSTYVRLVLREKSVVLVSKEKYDEEKELQHLALKNIFYELRRIGEVNSKMNFGIGSKRNLEDVLNDIKRQLDTVSDQQLALLTPTDGE